jgi:HD superfamily phosphohydrolase
MIGGIKKDLSNNDWQYKGRPREKGFLYEIVANNRFGLDVDKLDYLSRDSLNLGLSLVSANFDHKRIMHHLRVTKVGEDFLLSTRDKEHISMLKLFELRRQLFRTAYLHKTTVAVECMLLDAMLLANACIRTQNTKSKKEYKLCEIVQDLNAYCQLDDETLLSRIRVGLCVVYYFLVFRSKCC